MDADGRRPDWGRYRAGQAFGKDEEASDQRFLSGYRGREG
jgi:hypothetical protein